MQARRPTHATLWFCVPEIGERIIAGDSRKDMERTKERSERLRRLCQCRKFGRQGDAGGGSDEDAEAVVVVADMDMPLQPLCLASHSLIFLGSSTVPSSLR